MFDLLSPELSVGFTALLLLILEAAGFRERKGAATLAIVGLVLAGLLDLGHTTAQAHLFNGSYHVDALAVCLKFLMVAVTLMAVLVSVDYLHAPTLHSAEQYALMLFVCLGMMFMASAGDLVTIFIALETTSMPLYVLAASLRYDKRSSEAGLKFFILGALASAFYLFGAAMLLGSLGTIYVHEFPARLAPLAGVQHAVFLGLVCVLAGFAFKVAAAPFHMWAPDVYEGSPTPVTAFISTGPKVGGVAVLLRLLMVGFSISRPDMELKMDWVLVLSSLSLLSMIVGNLIAMHQTNLKRLMAYSGISHMGYVLMGLASGSLKGVAGVVFYLFVYTLTNLVAWGVIISYGANVGSEETSDFAGMSRRSPGLAALLLLCLLSLAGLPPLGGFVGKFYLFAAAWESGLWWLAVMGLLSSVASLYYYVGVLRVVYFEPAPTDEAVTFSGHFRLAGALGVFFTLALGLLPALSTWVFEVATAFCGKV